MNGNTCQPEIPVMTIRLYVDEDAMAHILVKGLRARGIDLLTVLEENMTGRNDEEQLEYAASLKRAFYYLQCRTFL